MADVITTSDPFWTAPFSVLSPRQFGKLITGLRREGMDPVRKDTVLTAGSWPKVSLATAGMSRRRP